MNKEILKRYFEGTSSDQEKKQVLEYFSGDDLSLLDALIIEENDLHTRQLPGGDVKQAFYQQLRQKISTRARRRILTPFIRIAAGILLLASVATLWMLVKNGPKQSDKALAENILHISNTGRQMKQVSLTDGTKVWLNPGTTISYDKNAPRQVILSGEAVFNVSRNEALPFEVKTGSLSTVVLGTTFRIEAYDNEINTRVTLLSGKVRVDSRIGNNTLLPGQELTLARNNDSISVQHVNTEGEEALLTSGMLVFRKLPLKDVLHRVERAFGISITVTDPLLPDGKFVTGTYYRNDANEILERILFIHGLHFKKDGLNHYIITR